MPIPRVFIAYSHEDEEWKDRIWGHLSVLERQKILVAWVDQSMQPGTRWREKILQTIDGAQLALLLISAHFLSSEFIAEVEVPRILKRHERGEIQVVPVLVRDCAWRSVPWLATLQIRPINGRPLAAHRGHQRDEALTAIVSELPNLLFSGVRHASRGRLAK